MYDKIRTISPGHHIAVYGISAFLVFRVTMYVRRWSLHDLDSCYTDPAWSLVGCNMYVISSPLRLGVWYNSRSWYAAMSFCLFVTSGLQPPEYIISPVVLMAVASIRQLITFCVQRYDTISDCKTRVVAATVTTRCVPI